MNKERDKEKKRKKKRNRFGHNRFITDTKSVDQRRTGQILYRPFPEILRSVIRIEKKTTMDRLVIRGKFFGQIGRSGTVHQSMDSW